MGANSVTGTGLGESGKMNVKELNDAVLKIQNMLSNMPIIVFSESQAAESTEDGPQAVFTIPATPEDADAYAFFATTENGGAATIVNIADNDDGQIIEVTVSSETEDTVWLMIVKKGQWLK